MNSPGTGDHYALLGVARDATTQEIKRAFRVLARECHPDVAGESAETRQRFERIRKAYEVLVDPVARGRYDRRAQRRQARPGGRFGWRPPGGGWQPSGGSEGPRQRGSDPSNDLGLDDIFGKSGGMGDFGFGSGTAGPNRRSGARASKPDPGRDIPMQVDVPAEIAARGGTVTLHYPRIRRGDDGLSLYQYDEICDLRVPPGTRSGDTLRVEKMGDAGSGGGPYGDLVCDILVEGSWEAPGSPSDEGPRGGTAGRRGPAADAGAGARPGDARAEGAAGQARIGSVDRPQTLSISIPEALLGGAVGIDTPQGRVKLTLPPCTAGGSRFRLRGRGELDSSGTPTDFFVILRVVPPPLLDEESQALIQRFAELNPDPPRED